MSITTITKLTKQQILDKIAQDECPIISNTEMFTGKKSEQLEKLNIAINQWNLTKDKSLFVPIWEQCDFILREHIMHCKVSKIEVMFVMANIAKMGWNEWEQLCDIYFRKLL